MFEQAWHDARRALRLERREDETRPIRLAVIGAVVSLLIGLVAMYFLDPRQGRGRRAQTVDRLAGSVRRGTRRLRQGGRRVAAEAYGVQQRLRHAGPDSNFPENDATLAHKVESLLFRDPDVPKGEINVHAEEGVVVLRGTARTPQEINDIEARVRSIHGVVDVRNMLHLPNMPDPQWAESVVGGRTPVTSGDRG